MMRGPLKIPVAHAHTPSPRQLVEHVQRSESRRGYRMAFVCCLFGGGRGRGMGMNITAQSSLLHTAVTRKSGTFHLSLYYYAILGYVYIYIYIYIRAYIRVYIYIYIYIYAYRLCYIMSYYY